MRHAIVVLLAGVVIAASAHATAAGKSPLELKVIVSGETSLNVTSTLIMGKTEAILVDVPFTRADGLRVAAEVLDSGKTLKAIYVTHDHPDHFFSVDVFLDLFPGVEVITAPQIVDDIWRSYPFKFKRWGAMLGRNGPRYAVNASAAKGSTLKLEGHTIEILGPMQGDHVHATAVYVPSLKAVICGDLCFNKVHLWLGEHEPAQYDAWLAAIDSLIALKPKIVVAGHKRPELGDGPEALAFTREYLVAFKDAAAKSKTSGELIAAITQRFPDTRDYLGDFVLGNSAKVATGEMPPWQE
jgi:glyoxylase-like metal-dependent hydrolase (beta-lactamase superfamily II)